jgi:hypothetical protein
MTVLFGSGCIVHADVSDDSGRIADAEIVHMSGGHSVVLIWGGMLSMLQSHVRTVSAVHTLSWL